MVAEEISVSFSTVVVAEETSVVLLSVKSELSDGSAPHPEAKAIIIKAISKVIIYLLNFIMSSAFLSSCKYLIGSFTHCR